MGHVCHRELWCFPVEIFWFRFRSSNPNPWLPWQPVAGFVDSSRAWMYYNLIIIYWGHAESCPFLNVFFLDVHMFRCFQVLATPTASVRTFWDESARRSVGNPWRRSWKKPCWIPWACATHTSWCQSLARLHGPRVLATTEVFQGTINRL